jgi:hypothetical protein
MENGMINNVAEIIKTFSSQDVVSKKTRELARLAIDEYDGSPEPDVDPEIKEFIRLGETSLLVRIPLGEDNE